MRITLDDLKRSPGVTIDLLEIISLEGQHYIARLLLNDEYHLLSDADGKTRLFRSSWQIQDTLAAFNVTSTDLVHPSAYHEMVGMGPSEVEPMRIRVQGSKT